MKHFGVYRKLILIAGTVIAAVSVGAVLFTESASALMLLIICAFSYLSNMMSLGFSKEEATDFLVEYSSKLKEPNK